MSNALRIKTISHAPIKKNGRHPQSGHAEPPHPLTPSAPPESEILAELRVRPWEEVVTERWAESDPGRYQTIMDRGRSLFLDFLPLRKGGQFLDIGSGWGQIALPLSKYGEVVCLDDDSTRLSILREIARQERCALRYVWGDLCALPFLDNQFDLVIRNEMPAGKAGADRYDRDRSKRNLEKVHAILKPGGTLYLGVENSLGLSHVLGAAQAVNGSQNPEPCMEAARARSDLGAASACNKKARAGSLNEYKAWLEETGLELMEIFGCFPDHRAIRMMIPLDKVNVIISEMEVPAPDNPAGDGNGLPRRRHAERVYRQLAENGIAQYFCPAYGLIARKPQ